MATAVQIRRFTEDHLAKKGILSPFTFHRKRDLPTLSTGIPLLDEQIEGVPIGAITEITSQPFRSSGLTSMQLSLLTKASQEGFCALIDATDSFDPSSAAKAGVRLERMLWVRCSGKEIIALEQAFKCADLLLQRSSGFLLVIVDLSGLREPLVRKIPLTTWFRFKTVIEKLPTALVISTPTPVTATCSGLVLRPRNCKATWQTIAIEGPSHSRFLSRWDFAIEVGRAPELEKPVQGLTKFSANVQWA